MAEISKGKRSTGRRSSILKRALADIDVNVKEKTEVIKSKRVSFAETCCVKEFPRDSPQTLKVAEHNDSADTSADNSLQDMGAAPDTSHPPKQDNVVGSSFALDDGETTFISDMANNVNFRESTRCFDRMDSNTFGEADGLDVSEIPQGENSVFVPAASTKSADTTVMPSETKYPGRSRDSISVDVGRVQFQPTGRADVQQVMTKGVSEMDFLGDGNRTILFDNQDGGTMDLTLMDMSRVELPIQNSPKVSARAFLNKIMAHKKGSEVHQAKEEQTLVFSGTGIESAMELTQNLPQHNFSNDFNFVPQPLKPHATLQNSESVPKKETRPANETIIEDRPKISAKSFLATLKRNIALTPAKTAGPESIALIKPEFRVSSSDTGQTEQREDGDMTMELTCTDPVDKPIIQALSTSRTCQPQSQKREQEEATPAAMEHEENATEMMELTGCVDSTRQLLVEANSSAITAPSLSTQGAARLSSVQSRNALMDITARYSISPPTPAAETQPSQNLDRPAEHVSQTTAFDQAAAAALPYQQRSNFASTPAVESGEQNKTATAFMGQENISLHTKKVEIANHKGAKIPLKPLQKDIKSPSPSSSVSFACQTNSYGIVSNGQYPLSSQDAPNQTVHFAAGEDTEMTHGFVSGVDDRISTSKSNQGVSFQTATARTSYTMSKEQHSLTTTSTQQKITVFGKDEAKDRIEVQKNDPEDLHEMTVAFNTEDTAANMSLTCNTLPLTVPREKSMNRTVVFNKEETAGNMTFTCALPEPSAPLDKLHSHKTILFGEETGANMSLTCTGFPSKLPSDRSVLLRTEKTVADMIMTCADLQGSDEKTLKSETQNTVSNRSLTCTNLTQTKSGHGNMQTTYMVPVENHQLLDKSIVFAKEATAANMSLTCVDLPAVEQNKTLCNERNQAVTFKSENGDSTQTTSIVSDEKRLSSEESIVFAKEATAANMSLTCFDLPAGEQNKTLCNERSQAVIFKSENGDIMQTTNTVSIEKHLSSVESIVFAKEATAANMSLTCVDLPALQNTEESVGYTSNHRDSIQTTNLVPAEKHLPTEKNVLSLKDAGAVNKSLTCVDLPILQNTEPKQSPCNSDSQVVTSTCKPVQYREKDKIVTFTADQNVVAMDMTCASSRTESVGEIIESVKQRTSVVSSSDNAAAQVNRTYALTSMEHFTDAQTNSTSAQSTDASDPSKENTVKEVEEEVDSDDVFFKKEPTTLMEITGILKHLQKKIEEGGPSEETGVEGVMASAENIKLHSFSTVQSNPETAETVASRKLQLSSATGTKMTDTFDSQTDKMEDRALSRTSLKRPSESSEEENEVPRKIRQLSSQKTSDSQSACVSAANKDPETHPENAVMHIEDRTCKSDDAVLVTSRSQGTVETMKTQMLSGSCSSSNNTNSLFSTDIFRETMPVFGQAASNTSMASVSALSVSTMQNVTTSFLSLGRSFVEKQKEEGSCFLQICEQLGITQSDLKGWVCRRSSVAVRPEVSCDTVEDQLNSASIVKQECESKMEFVSEIDAILQREEATSEELEKTVMRQITELGLVAEAQQSPSIQQQIRGLLLAGRKHAQVLWKTRKAERLNALGQKMENHIQAVSKDTEDMTASIEHMAAIKEKLDDSISQRQRQLESLKNQVYSRKQGTKYNFKQQELQQQRSDLMSVQQQVSEAKCSLDRLTQKEEDLQAERKRARQRFQDSLERQQQLTQSHDTLFALHCLHCWRPVCVEEQRVDFLLLYDSVLLSVSLTGSSSPHQPIASITVTNRVREGSEPWAVLAAELIVDTLSASSQSLVHTFPSRQHLQPLLDEVTRLVEDIKGLCQEVKLACLHHHVTIKGKQITAELWNIDRLRKVSLTTDIQVNSYPHNSLTWNIQVIMGDISDKQLQTTVEQVGAGKEHFTQVLQAVHRLLKQ